MSTEHVAAQQILKKSVDKLHGSLGYIIPREEFLPQAWEIIDSFIESTKGNSLVKATLARYPDFKVRGFALVTAQQGLFTYEPDNTHILKALINLLGEDLAKQEGSIYEQITRSFVRGYFPELAMMLQVIESIYGMEGVNLSLLPDTPYLGYQQLTLEYPRLICEEPTSPTIHEALIVLNMRSCVPIKGIEYAC